MRFRRTGCVFIALVCLVIGSSAAMAGTIAGTVNYDGRTPNLRPLKMALIELPAGTVELSYCSALSTESGFDFADVVVNNVLLERRSGSTGSWQTRVLDLSEFAGESIQIIFRLLLHPGPLKPVGGGASLVPVIV